MRKVYERASVSGECVRQVAEMSDEFRNDVASRRPYLDMDSKQLETQVEIHFGHLALSD